MSKEDKHIDNLFKEKLDGRSFDGPPADFLADLNQRLDAKPVVSKSWIWMIFLNFFIIGLFIANATIAFSTTKTAKAEPQIEKNEQYTAKEESFKSENSQSKSTSINADDAQTDNSTENGSLNSTKVKSKGLETNQVNQSSTEANRVEKNQNNNKRTDSNAQGDTGRKSESAKTTKNKNSKDSSTKNSSGNKKVSNTSADSRNKKASNTSTDSRNKVSSQASKKVNYSGSSQNDKSVAGNKTTEANKDKTETEKTTSNKEGVSINGTESISPYVNYSAIYATQFDEIDRKIKTNDFPEFPSPWNELVAEDNSKPVEKSPKKEDDAHKRMFELQLQGGATQWSFKTLGTNDNYVNDIDQSGTPKWTPNFGLAFNVNFNNISIGTGLDYAKFKTENLFEFGEVSTYDSTYIAGYNETVIYDTNGFPIDTTFTPYYDSTTVTDTTFNTSSITNEYEWIQIPLHIGYRFNLNKWAVIPRVGMNIGIGIRQSSGQYPTEAYDNLQTLSPVKWNLNLHTSLEVRREFGKWHAFGKFNYQRNLTPTIDNALFERKYNGTGFNFGVGYSF